MNILILMAGPSDDFMEKGYSYPKYLLEIQNKTLINRIFDSLKNVGDKIICIIKNEDQLNFFLGDTLKILCPGAEVLCVAGETKGAVCTALFAIDKINNDEEILILNGDQIIKSDISLAIDDFRKRKLDGGIITIKDVHPKYSSVLLDDKGFVIETSEKRPISNIASTGCCYFRTGADFVKSAFAVIEKDSNVQGRYYISSTYNEMILNQKKIGIYEIPRKDYVSFSTFQMYQNYLLHKK